MTAFGKCNKWKKNWYKIEFRHLMCNGFESKV
jgi:hypothetical protein